MTPEELLAIHGEVVDCATLKVAKAAAFVAFVAARPELGVTVVEVRRSQQAESLVIEIRVPVGQQPKNDIRRQELLLIAFNVADRAWPSVYSLRPDFPTRLPHLNVPWFGFPPSLCVSEQPYAEARRDWSPPYYIEILRGWLERTAKGTLHQMGQPLEPFLLHPGGTLIVPQSLVSESAGTQGRYVVRLISEGVYRVVRDDQNVSGMRRIAMMLVTTPPMVHGGIPAVPNNLADLAKMVDRDGFGLVARVKEHVTGWRYDRDMRGSLPLLMLQVPLARSEDAAAEHYDVQAFIALDSSVHELGVALDMWDKDDPEAAILFPDPSRDGSDVALYVMSVQKTLTRSDAAAYNGEAAPVVDFVAVGAGALGSQVLANLSRGGWQPRAVVDEDHLLPHNLARHLLFTDALGSRKAEAVVAAIDGVADEPSSTRAVVRDVLVRDEESDAAITNADVLLDMSASVAVACRVSIDLSGAARRMSLFLNPTGTDSVLLCEDRARLLRLDQIESQYYWAVASRGELHGHLALADPLRYGAGCRDVSSRIKQTSLAVHGGLGAAAFRRAVADPGAACLVWRLDEATGEVVRVVVPATRMRAVAVSDWTVFVSDALLGEMVRHRVAALPSETGGVLMGCVDMERRLAYLVGSVPAPPDSKGWSTGYVRGSRGLQRAVATLCGNAGGHLKYLGEWHSHPDGASTEPSGDDKNAYRWFADALADEGRPPIMLILGARDVRCVVDLAETTIGLAA